MDRRSFLQAGLGAAGLALFGRLGIKAPAVTPVAAPVVETAVYTAIDPALPIGLCSVMRFTMIASNIHLHEISMVRRDRCFDPYTGFIDPETGLLDWDTYDSAQQDV